MGGRDRLTDATGEQAGHRILRFPRDRMDFPCCGDARSGRTLAFHPRLCDDKCFGERVVKGLQDLGQHVERARQGPAHQSPVVLDAETSSAVHRDKPSVTHVLSPGSQYSMLVLKKFISYSGPEYCQDKASGMILRVCTGLDTPKEGS